MTKYTEEKNGLFAETVAEAVAAIVWASSDIDADEDQIANFASRHPAMVYRHACYLEYVARTNSAPDLREFFSHAIACVERDFASGTAIESLLAREFVAMPRNDSGDDERAIVNHFYGADIYDHPHTSDDMVQHAMNHGPVRD